MLLIVYGRWMFLASQFFGLGEREMLVWQRAIRQSTNRSWSILPQFLFVPLQAIVDDLRELSRHSCSWRIFTRRLLLFPIRWRRGCDDENFVDIVIVEFEIELVLFPGRQRRCNRSMRKDAAVYFSAEKSSGSDVVRERFCDDGACSVGSSSSNLKSSSSRLSDLWPIVSA